MQARVVNEVVIFCESYPQVKNALYMVTQNCHNHPVTVVIPGMDDLYKFFKLVNERVFQGTINIVYFDIYLRRIAKASNRIIKVLYLLPDIVKERRYLKGIFNKHFAQLRGAEVYFFSRGYNPSAFYLLKKLSKTNQLVYMPEPTYDVLIIERTAPTNITELIYLAICKLAYGYDILLGKLHPSGRKITLTPDRFFRKNVSRVFSREERDSMLKEFDFSKFKVFDDADYNIIYFHQNLAESDYIADSGAYERRLNEVFEVIGKYFPENRVALKYHPNYSEGKAMMPFGNVLPDFIPAEFLYSEKVKMYLSISSQALANVEKGLAVSLIDLVGFKNNTIREQLKEMLIQWSHSEILFPQSLDEFERILIDINKQTLELKGG